MAASASSLHFLSLTPQTLSLSKPNSPFTSSLSLFSIPTVSQKFSISSSSSFPPASLKPFDASVSSRFVRNVTISSELEVEDGEDVDDGGAYGDEPNFSPDLKLFVGNLPYNADSAALAGLFERAGNVLMVEVIYDKSTGRSRGFGFVTMSTIEEVAVAVQQFNGYEFEGRPLRVSSGPPPPRRENSPFRGSRGGGMPVDNSNRVYVGNLAWGVDDLALERLFSDVGKVTEARVIYDRDSGRSRGFGFVTYSTADEVNSAIESLDGADLGGRPIRVSPAESRPRRQF